MDADSAQSGAQPGHSNYSWLGTNDSDSSAADHAISVLALEYGTLRAEILARNANRFQFLAGGSAAITLLAGALTLSPHHWSTWAVVLLGAVLLGAGLATFIHMGHKVIAVSERLATIESRINDVMRHKYGATFDLLVWESSHQTRPGTPRLLPGKARRSVDEP